MSNVLLRTAIWNLALVSLAGHASPIATDGAAGQHVVRISSLQTRTLDVRAELITPDGKIYGGSGGDDYLERGWATYIDVTSARTRAGRELFLEPFREEIEENWFANGWLVRDGTEPFVGPVEFTYTLRLDYLDETHPYGDEQGGKRFAEAIYTVARPIFVNTNRDSRHVVRFDIPESWEIATPWKPRPGEPRTYEVGSNRQLQSNPLVLGKYGEFHVEHQGFELSLVLPGPIAQEEARVAAALREVVPCYLDLFPDTPPQKYVMVFFYAPAEDGEGYSEGSVFTTATPVDESSSILWANFLAHELGHYWNGRLLHGSPRWERQWFSEGFTEYFANLVLVNRGLISEAMFIKKMEQHLGNYRYFLFSGLFRNVSIREAGKDKGRNRPGVYSGGWAIAFAMDTRIRKSTGAQRDLSDFMKLLHDRFGTTEKSYAFEDLVAAASEVAGSDQAEFFETYVSQRNELPLSEILGEYGLQGLSKAYANEFYIVPVARPDREQRREWRWLTRERFAR